MFLIFQLYYNFLFREFLYFSLSYNVKRIYLYPMFSFNTIYNISMSYFRLKNCQNSLVHSFSNSNTSTYFVKVSSLVFINVFDKAIVHSTLSTNFIIFFSSHSFPLKTFVAVFAIFLCKMLMWYMPQPMSHLLILIPLLHPLA